MEMHTDVNAVPHAGLGSQFLGSRTNSKLKAMAFRLEVIGSRWGSTPKVGGRR